MKVILLKDTPHVGQKDDVVNVSNGHARNFLIPRGFADEASSSRIAESEATRAQREKDREAAVETLLVELNKFDGETVTLKAKANEQGHLFEGITANAVVKAINDQKGTSFEAAHIGLKKPLKETGEHSVTITVGEGSATGAVVIEAEE